MEYTITVYGTEWCGDTKRSRAHLEQRGLEYNFIYLEKDDSAAKQVEAWNDGARRTPAIEIKSKGETRLLKVPSNDELDHALRESHVDTESSATTRRSGVSSGGEEDAA